MWRKQLKHEPEEFNAKGVVAKHKSSANVNDIPQIVKVNDFIFKWHPWNTNGILTSLLITICGTWNLWIHSLVRFNTFYLLMEKQNKLQIKNKNKILEILTSWGSINGGRNKVNVQSQWSLISLSTDAAVLITIPGDYYCNYIWKISNYQYISLFLAHFAIV